jgi:4-hydroxy 2-oxovalerate aldolase
MKILDCTLRDGGYYTNWDFNDQLVNTYMQSMNSLPIEYIEIGYRSMPKSGYLGEYYYLPVYVIERLKSLTTKKLVVILDEKDTKLEDLDQLLKPCVGLVTMVRMAIDPANFERAITLAREIKKMRFEVGFNVMYMSKWKGLKGFWDLLPQIEQVSDYFYMVDSYGGVYPEDVREIFEMVSSKTNVPIGFHGHNNLELGLINTLTALECGAKIVDSTVTGMGRGAGNLKTELLLTALNAKNGLEFDFNALSKTVTGFEELREKYQWGTNLPYMVSGANSLPQKDVMDWVGKRYYSFNSIIRALHNQSLGLKDNQELPKLNVSISAEKLLIVGGGESVNNNVEAIRNLLQKNPEMVVVHSSSKNALVFSEISNQQFFCLVGNEGHRMEEIFKGKLPEDAICVLPPYPRKMGTYVPELLANRSFELSEINFTDTYIDSCSAIALQLSLGIQPKIVYVVGYDGYSDAQIGQKEQELFLENEYLFEKTKPFDLKLISLTPTSYAGLEHHSIFSLI